MFLRFTNAASLASIVGLFLIAACKNGEDTDCSIVITEILNLRVAAIGDFSQETDPHKDGRLFIDTRETWDGSTLVPAHYDKQRAKLTVRVMLPEGADPATARVRWELRDPDDPATSATTDPNGGTGGDNTGKVHEGDAHWFAKADHDLVGTPVDTAAVDETTVIGLARTQIDAALRSTIFFNYSDDGGDNFRIKAVLEVGEEACAEDKSGLLTLWRKRFVKVFAMALTDDVQEIRPGDGAGGAGSAVVSAGPNATMDTAPNGDDALAGAAGPITAGPNSTADTDMGNWYPGANVAAVRMTLRDSYANAPADKLPYIDIVVDDATGPPQLTQWTEFDSDVTDPEISAYERDKTNYHTGAATPAVGHPDVSYMLVGIKKQAVYYADSVHDPDVLIAVDTVPAATLAKTTSHELGHNIMRESINIHTGHSAGGCLGNQGDGHPNTWCPKHARDLRENASRTWNNHNTGVANPAEATRDSD